MSRAIRALNRFGLGARIGEPPRIGLPHRWVIEQLDGPAPLLDDARLPSPDEIGNALRALRESQGSRDEQRRAEARRAIRAIAERELKAALDRRVTSDRPYVERLVAFWSNHLCISVAAKGVLAPLAGWYEREAIRPHVLGKFEDMVLASARHPAMLLYLDNAQSIGPQSPVGRRAARANRARGLNENYARELLELHTLGVHGGYTQQDVIELARILTGWGVEGVGRGPRRGGRSDGAPGFVFREPVHEPGARTVLGVRYPQTGVGQGDAVIRDLCRHPATARFIAGKLVRHFVSDEPATSDVQRVAHVFQRTGGDLRAVSRELVSLESAWEPANRKFRTPHDWLVAVLRAFHAEEAPPVLANALRQLRHTPWGPPSPKGYGDLRQEWADPDGLMNRAELARTVARRIASRGSVDPALLLEIIEGADASPLPTLLADESIPPIERIALAIGGPAFQWR